jgi:hypothetical protein
MKLIGMYFLPEDLHFPPHLVYSKVSFEAEAGGTSKPERLFLKHNHKNDYELTTKFSQKSPIKILDTLPDNATEIYFSPIKTSNLQQKSKLMRKFMKAQFAYTKGNGGVLIPTSYTSVGDHYGKTAYTGITGAYGYSSAKAPYTGMFAIQEEGKIVTIFGTLHDRYPLLSANFEKLLSVNFERIEQHNYSEKIDITNVRNPLIDAEKYSNNNKIRAWVVYHLSNNKVHAFVPILSLDRFKPGNQFFIINQYISSKHMYVFDLKKDKGWYQR